MLLTDFNREGLLHMKAFMRDEITITGIQNVKTYEGV